MPTEPAAPPQPNAKTKELHVRIEPIHKLYTEEMSHLYVRSRSCNYFIMIAYHVDSNFILVEPLQSHNNHHRLATANRIMYQLQKNRHSVEMHMLDNK